MPISISMARSPGRDASWATSTSSGTTPGQVTAQLRSFAKRCRVACPTLTQPGFLLGRALPRKRHTAWAPPRLLRCRDGGHRPGHAPVSAAPDLRTRRGDRPSPGGCRRCATAQQPDPLPRLLGLRSAPGGQDDPGAWRWRRSSCRRGVAGRIVLSPRHLAGGWRRSIKIERIRAGDTGGGPGGRPHLQHFLSLSSFAGERKGGRDRKRREAQPCGRQQPASAPGGADRQQL